VILPDGRNLNQEIVKAGFAWWFRKYAPNDKFLEALESAARKAKRGLWVGPNAMPPWEYRKDQEPQH
jgi:micrococcal nuclease